MFTGIIQDIGIIRRVSSAGKGAAISVYSERLASSADIGDSIAVNGVCLSVVSNSKNIIMFDAVGNTLNKTDLKFLKKGDKVNLEDAVKFGDKISGHMVTGHIDGIRKIKTLKDAKEGVLLEVCMEPGDERYVVERGSVAVDGISLTVAGVCKNVFRMYIIPITLKETVLKFKRNGDFVNVEFDVLAKYAEKGKDSGVSMEKLRSLGF